MATLTTHANLLVDQYTAGLMLTLRTLRVWLGDDRAIEDSPSKLIYIGLSLAVVAAVGVILWRVLDSAEQQIPDPVVPAGGGGDG
jgi:hypothetical protein